MKQFGSATGCLIALSLSFFNATHAHANDANPGHYNCKAEETIAQTGKASYYGNKFHGKKTASGEIYNMYAMTAASNTFPMGTLVQVNYGKQSVIVKINDTGGFKKHGRIIDLSRAAAEELGFVQQGIGKVAIQECIPI